MDVDQTEQRILLAALKTLLQQGVKRSSLVDIAFEAGVTRITTYRYFGGKTGLVKAVCGHLAGIFRRVAEGTPQDSSIQIDARLARLAQELACLPPGNPLSLFDEIRRLYPAIFEEFRLARETALNQIFEQAVAAAAHEDRLRDGINLQVVRAMFWALVVGLVETPPKELIAAEVPYVEICQTITAVLRHGILKRGDHGEGLDD